MALKEQRRVAVLGLHGASPHYIEPLLAAGRMPNWKHLAASGSWGKLLAPLPLSDGAFVTLLTGLDFDQHGVISAFKVDARQFPPVWAEEIGSTSYQQETFLALASQAGYKVAGINIPNTAPPWPVNGVLIAGIPVPDEVRPPTFPPALARQIVPMNLCRVSAVNVNDIQSCHRYLDFNLARTLEVTKKIYTSERFDLLVSFINTPDFADHFFVANPALGEAWRPVIEEYYEKIDGALGEFERLLDTDTVLIVVSERGGGAFPPLLFRPNVWLEQRGLLKRRKRIGGQTGVLEMVHKAYRLALRTGIARRLKQHLPLSWVKAGWALSTDWSWIDLNKTQVYAVEHFYPLLAFEINLRGRQADGIVNPGREYESLRDELVRELQGLRLPDGSRPLCRSVHRREELFTGPRAELLADVIAELDPDVKADLHLGRELFLPNPGEPIIPYRGYHTREGVLLLRGPGVRRGVDLACAQLRDVAPTVLHLLGLPVPTDRRGKISPAIKIAGA